MSTILLLSGILQRLLGLPSVVDVYQPLSDPVEVRSGFRMLVPTAPHQEHCFIRDIAVLGDVWAERRHLMVPHPQDYF